MISTKQLIDELNKSLNEKASDSGLSVGFQIYSDFGDYDPPTFEKNVFTKFVQGVASLTASSIVPINGLKVASETLSVSLAIEIEKGVDKSTGDLIVSNESEIEGIKAVLNSVLSNSSAIEIKDEREQNTTFTVAVYGSQLQTQIAEIRSNVGASIEFSFNLYYSFVENGINSSFIDVEVDGEKLFFTQLIMSRTPSMDGGAFDGTEGTARSYPTVSGFELDLTLPALKDSAFCNKALAYLVSGEVEVMSVNVSIGGNDWGIQGEYSMIFAPTHITVQGIENAGLSVKLVQYLEANNGGV